jgi:hypothetical protein
MPAYDRAVPPGQNSPWQAMTKIEDEDDHDWRTIASDED